MATLFGSSRSEIDKIAGTQDMLEFLAPKTEDFEEWEKRHELSDPPPDSLTWTRHLEHGFPPHQVCFFLLLFIIIYFILFIEIFIDILLLFCYYFGEMRHELSDPLLGL